MSEPQQQMMMLANVQRQDVHLVVNPGENTIKGWTDIYAAPPADGHTSIGLHTLGHTITDVSVQGLPAEFTLTPPPQPELGEVQPDTKVTDIAEQAYFNYLTMVVHELQPNMVIQLPVGWDVELQKHRQERKEQQLEQEKQQQEAAAKPAAGPGPASPPSKSVKGSKQAQGVDKEEQQAPAPPPEPPILIRLSFHKVIDPGATTTATFVPGQEATDTCESMYPPQAAQNRYLVSDPQLRRARALFPCADVPGALTVYRMYVTVPPDHVAVCDGVLKRCVMSHVTGEDGQQVPQSRTYEFESEIPVNVNQALVTTGPLAVVPMASGGGKQTIITAPPATGKAAAKQQQLQQQLQQELGPSCCITSFGPPGTESLVSYTSRPLHLILKVYEKYLGCRFPFNHLYVVFLPAAAFRARDPPVIVGSNIILASTSLLVSPDAIEAVVNTTLTLSYAVARCLFGGLVVPMSTEDAWVVEGLAVHLSEVWLASWLGKNELAYRRHKERQALAMADNAGVPPLCARGSAKAITVGGAIQLTVAYGTPFGTELLELGPLRRWKSSAIIRMFEKRVGEDQFKRVLGGMVSKAHATGGSTNRWRNIATDRFLKVIQKNSGNKGIEAFAQRWIYGRGCPELELGIVYYKKNNTVDLVLRQGGNPACRKAALLALKAAKEAGGEDDAQGQLKVVIHEADANSEVLFKLTPTDTLVLHAGHELVTKPAGKKPGGRKTKGQKDEVKQEAPGPEEGAEVTQGQRQPLLYVRLDPAGDWLCSARVHQPEASWVAQLDKSRDVVSQSLAVAGLARLAGPRGQSATAIVAALSACLKNSNVYCRVRAEAALALGMATVAEITLPVLGGCLHEVMYDPTSLSLRPNCFADLSEYVVLSALPVALGLLRAEGTDASPPEAMDAVLDFLDNCDNTGNPYSDAGLVACFVEAVGHMQPSKPQQLARLLAALDRWLALEDLSPSPQYVIGCACLTAMHRLADRLTTESEPTRENVKLTLKKYASPGVPLALRHAAAHAMMAHVVACTTDDKGSALLNCMFDLRSAGGWGAGGRAALIASAFNVMGDLLSEKCVRPSLDDPENSDYQERLQDFEEETAVSLDLTVRLYQCMKDTQDAYERQYIFMLLQRVAKQDPSLYREREEEAVDANASQQEMTVRSGQAVTAGGRHTTGPAMSGGTTATLAAGGAGTAAAAQAAGVTQTKFRLKLPGIPAAGAGPTASGGTIGGVASGGTAAAHGSPTRSHVTSKATGPTSSIPREARTTSLLGTTTSLLGVRMPVPNLAAPATMQADDEVVQPMRSGGAHQPVIKTEDMTSAGADGVGGASPPRDPRMRATTTLAPSAGTTATPVASRNRPVPVSVKDTTGADAVVSGGAGQGASTPVSTAPATHVRASTPTSMATQAHPGVGSGAGHVTPSSTAPGDRVKSTSPAALAGRSSGSRPGSSSQVDLEQPGQVRKSPQPRAAPASHPAGESPASAGGNPAPARPPSRQSGAGARHKSPAVADRPAAATTSQQGPAAAAAAAAAPQTISPTSTSPPAVRVKAPDASRTSAHRPPTAAAHAAHASHAPPVAARGATPRTSSGGTAPAAAGTARQGPPPTLTQPVPTGPPAAGGAPAAPAAATRIKLKFGKGVAAASKAPAAAGTPAPAATGQAPAVPPATAVPAARAAAPARPQPAAPVHAGPPPTASAPPAPVQSAFAPTAAAAAAAAPVAPAAPTGGGIKFKIKLGGARSNLEATSAPPPAAPGIKPRSSDGGANASAGPERKKPRKG